MVAVGSWTADRRRLLGRVATILTVTLVSMFARAHAFGSVFRRGDVVLPGNDPYWYRYLVEQTVAASDGLVDVPTLVTVLAQLHGRDPALVLSLSWITELLGGNQYAAGVVSAWYPVVVGVASIWIVYGIVYRLTGNHWAATVSAVVLAITPVHALRTGLGFADHHAGDYLWLAVTAFCLVWLAEQSLADEKSSRWWVVAGILGLAIAGQVFWWIAGPFLVIPVGGYVAVRALSAVQAGQSPLRGNVPVVAAVGVAVVVVWLGQPLLNRPPFDVGPRVYALSLAALLGGIAVVLLFGEVIHRAGLPAWILAAAEIAGIGVGAWLLTTALTGQENLLKAAGAALSVLTPGDGIAEAVSLFGGPLGPVTGPLSLFGLFLFIGLPYLVVATRETIRSHRPAWLVLVTYGWFYLGLAALQRRFAGELSMFVAVFAAVGVIDLAVRAGVIRRDSAGGAGVLPGGDWRLRLAEVAPSRSHLSVVVILIFLIITVSFVQIPIKMNQVTVEGDAHDAAITMEQAAAEAGLPDRANYVLAPWGRSRMYNYFVSGKVFTGTTGTGHGQPLYWARRYYYPFLAGRDGGAWYSFLRRNGTGFVVTRSGLGTFPNESLYTRLHRHYGSRHGSVPGVEHYRLVYASPDGSPKAYMLVPGATVAGTGPPNSTITLSTRVTVPGASFTYSRVARVNASGQYRVTVPYAGRYAVGDTTVTVSEAAVLAGHSVQVNRTVASARPRFRPSHRHDLSRFRSYPAETGPLCLVRPHRC